MNKKEERNELQKFFEMEAEYVNFLCEFLHEKYYEHKTTYSNTQTNAEYCSAEENNENNNTYKYKY
ncbi:MAG: hypothetical protein LBO69_02400 [Ignavibacteria bacterium]|jgi:hypothetical protein|nr:hypothetical protein [Ignavibacteria bacterium]